MKSIEKIKDLVIYKDDRYYCGPGCSAVMLATGDIVVAFRRAYNWVAEGFYTHGWPNTECCLTRSSDKGETWSEPRLFYGGALTNQNIMSLPDGTLLCVTHRGELLPRTVHERLKGEKYAGDPHREFGFIYAAYGVQVLRSKDDGVSWEGPFFISPIPGAEPVLSAWPSPANLRGAPVLLDDGTVGVAVYTHAGKSRDDSEVWFMASEDQGITWTPRGCIAEFTNPDLCHNETAVYQCDGGKLVAFIRTNGDPDDRLHTSVSKDEGRSWSPPKREEVKGHPYQTARLSSGNVLLAYGYRHDPMGVRARLLDPQCEDISGAEEIVLRNDGGMRDLGYPHVLPLSHDRALVTYYHNIGGSTRHIAATIVAEV